MECPNAVLCFIPYLALAAALSVAIPTVLFCFNPGLLRARFEAGPGGIRTRASRRALWAVGALERAGFEALGVKTEKTPLRPTVRELAFVAADRSCYASVGGGRFRSSFYLYTPVPGGGFVLTSNGTFPNIVSGRVIQRSWPGCGVDELLKRHGEALGQLARRGEVLPTQQARIDATYAYYAAPEIRKVLRTFGVVMTGFGAAMAWVTLNLLA